MSELRIALILLIVVIPGSLMLQGVYAINLPSVSINLSGTKFSLEVTYPSSPTVKVGSALTGATTTATGTMFYDEFLGGSCSGALVLTLSSGVTPGPPYPVPGSRVFTLSSAGTFSFRARYSGDANNYPATSLCSVPVKVIGTTTTITTQTIPITPASIPVDGSLTNDHIKSATGYNIATATGTVTYRLYTGPTCSGSLVQSQTVTINPSTPGVFPPSQAFTITFTGTFSLQATYSGDSVYPLLNAGSTSPCESPVTVTKATPTLGTSLSANVIIVGQSVSDAAILSLATPTAGGTVTYNLFNNGVCVSPSIASNTVTVTNGVVPNSKPFMINSVGMVSFTAVYSGDSNNAGATSGCEGPVNVFKTTPTLYTTLSTFSITAGHSVTDTATLSGASSNAGGTVTFNLYDDGTCGASGGVIVQTYTVTVTAGSVPSVSFTISTSGSYSVVAGYSGDSNNKSATSGCEGVITVS